MENEYATLNKSKIHNNGVFARRDIPKGTYVIEYVGEKITKKEGERRAFKMMDDAEKDPSKGAVYIFELDDKYDIDGTTNDNIAKFVNHSCEPNCESVNDDDEIWVVALKDIKAGEELTYNYGYGVEEYEEHPCKCGSKKCVGFILGEEHWGKIKN